MRQTTSELGRSLLGQLHHGVKSRSDGASLFTITPEMASIILERHNTGNRPVSKNTVERYARTMASGKWMLTGEPLIFSDGNRLLNGQHRLMACVKSGEPLATYVVLGIEDKAFARMDRGNSRTGSDVLAIAGVPNSIIVSHAIRWIYQIEHSKTASRISLEPADILRLYEERYSSVQDFLSIAHKIYQNAGQSRGLAAALLYCFHRANPLKEAEFAAAWAEQKWEGKFRPIGSMQSRIKQYEAKTLGRISETTRAALIIQAWNLFVAGKVGRLADVYWTSDEEFPRIQRA